MLAGFWVNGVLRCLSPTTMSEQSVVAKSGVVLEKLVLHLAPAREAAVSSHTRTHKSNTRF